MSGVPLEGLIFGYRYYAGRSLVGKRRTKERLSYERFGIRLEVPHRLTRLNPRRR